MGCGSAAGVPQDPHRDRGSDPGDGHPKHPPIFQARQAGDAGSGRGGVPPGGDDPAEKPLPFPLRNIYKQRLRLGIPALFHYLNKKGYDIWVYSAGYYSADYIQRLFRKYGVHVTGAVTGTGRKTGEDREIRRELEALITAKYPETVHIDDAAVLRIFSQTKQVEEYNLGEGTEAWAKRVIDVMETFERHG